jgi:hypothetical protein
MSLVLGWLVAWGVTISSQTLSAQTVSKNSVGLNELKSERMTLITDKDIDDELRNWPLYLDQSIDQWKQIFRPEPARLAQLHTTVCLVGDRKKWESLGLLKEVPWLEEGFQYGDTLYIVEQPSEFYRRMLFLHEATHWIMYRWQGGAGSPWLMEGMADYLSTHQLDGTNVRLGYFPKNAAEVPSWGRIKQVQTAMKQGTAPKLSEILSFADMRQRRMDRYCWSWAAVSFFDHHPEYQSDFQSLYRGELDYSLAASQALYGALEPKWKRVSIQWRCFVDDLDFGYDFGSALILPETQWQSLGTKSSHQAEIDARKGWQSTGCILEAGETAKIEASGDAIIRKTSNGKTWSSSPRGVSVEYFRGCRLGSLVGVLASVDEEQPSIPWERELIGNRHTITANKRSLLLLRVNERSSELADNEGRYTVAISRN